MASKGLYIFNKSTANESSAFAEKHHSSHCVHQTYQKFVYRLLRSLHSHIIRHFCIHIPNQVKSAWHTICPPPSPTNLTKQIPQRTTRLRSRLRCLCSRCTGSRSRRPPEPLTSLLLGQVTHSDLLRWCTRLLRRNTTKQARKRITTSFLGCTAADTTADASAGRHYRRRG
jgi:hypothetical protein